MIIQNRFPDTTFSVPVIHPGTVFHRFYFHFLWIYHSMSVRLSSAFYVERLRIFLSFLRKKMFKPSLKRQVFLIERGNTQHDI